MNIRYFYFLYFFLLIGSLSGVYAQNKAEAAATKQLLTALKNPDRTQRTTALEAASAYADTPMYIDVYKTMAKAKPEVKTDILQWITKEAANPEKKEKLRRLEIKFDLPGTQVLANQLKTPDNNVKEATAQVMSAIGHPDFIGVLTGMLSSPDNEEVTIAQKALSTFPGDIDRAVARIIPQAGDAGKIAGLELLAERKANANVHTVFDQLKSISPEVRKAALVALKEVVSEKDFTLLAGMLESAEEDAIPYLQQAVISSLDVQDPATRFDTVSRRMILAGESKKHLYFTALATTGLPDVLPLLTTAYQNGNEAAREALQIALKTATTDEERTAIRQLLEEEGIEKN
ncbi:HEAT repeat protein [Parabacteroides sp. PFB2-10]|uniref:hypothetical protein n=1 Tax=Parabacteroides sp. PFB2-10 TaxID=1742405 RepID=UPI00247691EF|nr:hypothetical protein [Parabacteroides sp. PFB2-10]MDH6313181.1 HEAT repeat protein [Parabacteroides sp. PFB2-10]